LPLLLLVRSLLLCFVASAAAAALQFDATSMMQADKAFDRVFDTVFLRLREKNFPAACAWAALVLVVADCSTWLLSPSAMLCADPRLSRYGRL
jgi:hypothetical protein